MPSLTETDPQEIDMAHALLSRRAVLGHGMAAAVLANSTFTISHDRLGELIAVHRDACAAWCDACDEDLCRRQGRRINTGEQKRLSKIEQEAVFDILRWRPSSLGENARRLSYLLSDEGPWGGCLPTEEGLTVFHASLMPECQA